MTNQPTQTTSPQQTQATPNGQLATAPPPQPTPATPTPPTQANPQQVSKAQAINTTAVTPTNPQTKPASIQQPSPPKSSPKHLSTEQIKSKSLRLTQIAGLIVLIALGTNAGLWFFTNSRLKELNEVRQQILTTQSNTQDLQNASIFLQSQKEKFDPIKNALPNESTLVDFVQAVETIADSSASSSSLEFSALAPRGDNLEKYIPFNINLTTDEPNFYEFLKKLEKLPYIVAIDGIEADILGPGSKVWSYTISARVYVQEPF